MQRFNDFTKKSVKVVSAVLFAAMVTSWLQERTWFMQQRMK